MYLSIYLSIREWNECSGTHNTTDTHIHMRWLQKSRWIYLAESMNVRNLSRVKITLSAFSHLTLLRCTTMVMIIHEKTFTIILSTIQQYASGKMVLCVCVLCVSKCNQPYYSRTSAFPPGFCRIPNSVQCVCPKNLRDCIYCWESRRERVRPTGTRVKSGEWLSSKGRKACELIYYILEFLVGLLLPPYVSGLVCVCFFLFTFYTYFYIILPFLTWSKTEARVKETSSSIVVAVEEEEQKQQMN